jgi:hypothetical protein
LASYSLSTDSISNNYLYNLSLNDLLQSHWDMTSYGLYYKPKSTDFLFSDKPWWMNFFIGCNVKLDTILYTVIK